MNIDDETLKKVAFLSRINIDNDINEVKKDFEDMLSLLEVFEEVNVDNVKPMITPAKGNTICRKDEVTEAKTAEAILSNAPAKEFGYFVVPKVVE